MISLKIIPVALIFIVIIYLASLSFLTRHHQLKAENKRDLTPCPNKPNCVLSLSNKKSQSIKAFPLIDNNKKLSWEKLISAIKKSEGEILVNDGKYCHAVFTSTLFRFKDDLEIVLNDSQIEIRSASRAGKSDLGQNRKRVEKLRLLYH
ncbi:MAG: DUF1499 domain-containing protein [Gammaproteobacteria bacterium]|nr:DUF1499 domain-containing protein [Gammaproteobacteria bacterium]